jgi:HrpA-like RNA helicase
MLMEAGWCGIAITQPRRLPTISLAKRVAQECNMSVGGGVTYQVRHEASIITN